DGLRWSLVNSPNPTTVDNVSLSDLTCSTSADCWAVGGYSGITLIAHYDGTAWSIVKSPGTGSSDADSLNSVTCAAAGDCRAVRDGPRSAAHGLPAPVFVLDSGSLPPGLTLGSGSGTLAGTPSAAGTFTFVVRAKNGISPDALTPPVTIVVAPPNADLSVSLAAPTSVEQGATITYQLTVTNLGPSPASGVLVSLDLPRGTRLKSAPVGATFDMPHRAVDWSRAELNSGVQVEFTVTVRADALGALTSLAAVHSLTLDLQPANNAGSAVTVSYRVLHHL